MKSEMAVSQHFMAWICSAELDNRYLYYWLQSKKPEFERMANGSTIKTIGLAYFRDLQIVKPPIAEQRAIAAALSDVDALIAGLDRLIAKKRDIKHAAMQQLLTGQTRLPGFSGKWNLKRLGDVAEVVMGQSPSSSNYNTAGHGLPLVQGNADICNRLAIKRVFTTQLTKKGNAGDILLSVRAPVGEVARLTFDACLGRGVCAIRSQNDFLYHLLIYLEPTWQKLSKGSTFESVNSADVIGVAVYLPVEDKEQGAISSQLSDMDADLAALESRLAKTRAIKQGMMQELLTGRTRLVDSVEHAHVQTAEPAIERKANVYFMRSVLAAEIVDQLHQEPTFGHVKFEKMMFLAEHLCQVDTGSHYVRQAAGPLDRQALHSIDSQLRIQKWFDVRKENGRYRYVPLEKRGGHQRYFDRYFAPIRTQLSEILDTFRSWETERCEIVATLYGAWNDLLREQGSVSDDMIVREVLNNWHEAKQRIPQERWMKALGWMREKGYVPGPAAQPTAR